MKDLNVEAKMQFWILIFFFIQVSKTQDYDSTGNTEYCYKNPEFCVECGCFKTGLTEHTLSCGENEVIRLELDNKVQTIKSLPFNTTDPTCNLISSDKDFCKDGFSNNATTTYTDRVEVYRNCTLQNTCNITIGEVKGGNVKLVRYPYVCESTCYIHNVSTAFSRRLSNPVFYFKGLDYISKTINCDCSVYKSSGNLEVEIFYLHGDNICNKFDILPNTQLINCTDDVQLNTAAENIQSNSLKIEIRNMTVTADEVVFFKVYGEDLNVTCTGCMTNKDSISTKSSNSPTTESTTSNINNGQGSLENGAGFISMAEHEEKLDGTYAIFGGIIAAIIVVVLLGIVMYCFIRKRQLKKVKKEQSQVSSQPPMSSQQPIPTQQPIPPQQPMSSQQPVSSQQPIPTQQSDSPQGNGGIYSHYNYVDLDLPRDTDTTNKHPETSKPKHDGKQSQRSKVKQAGVAQTPRGNKASPNLYFEIEADTQDKSKTEGKMFALQKPEEKKQTKANALYCEPIKFKNKKPVQKERNSGNSTSNIGDLTEDTYNHVGDTNEPNVARNRVLSESHIKPIAKLKPIRYNHTPIDGVPTSVGALNKSQSKSPINPRFNSNPSANNYSHVKNVGIRAFPRSNQSNYDHIDDSFVIMDSSVDREDTYSHIQDKPRETKTQSGPRTQDTLPKSSDLPMNDDFYENVQLEKKVKADNSVTVTSLYNDENGDIYNHLANSNIVKL